ncbi:MAG: hypothetical protein N3A61_05515 [Ignavibacteria bacterium]|nr:hypothetical protein [Ignavibacteria bacterium]
MFLKIQKFLKGLMYGYFIFILNSPIYTQSKSGLENCPFSILFIEVINIDTIDSPLWKTNATDDQNNESQFISFNYTLKLTLKIEGSLVWNEPFAIKITTPCGNVSYNKFNLECLDLQPNIFYDFIINLTMKKNGYTTFEIVKFDSVKNHYTPCLGTMLSSRRIFLN